MLPDLGTFRIEKAIVHEVPQRYVRKAGPGPNLSEIESPLDRDLANYFERKVSGSLAEAALDVIFDPTAGSPIPDLIRDSLSTRNQSFVATSRDMAKHLHEVQTGVNPAGLLAVLEGTLAGRRCLAILKLEKESGVRVEQLEIDGKRTLSVLNVRDLILTDQTRVFKVCLFHSDQTAISGHVSDKQQGRVKRNTDVADFFLRFLGCRYQDDPEVTTRDFYRATEHFLNEQIEDPQLHAKVQLALISEMESNRPTLSAGKFAAAYLPVNQRTRFESSLAEQGVTTTEFSKNTALIKSHIQKMQLAFKSGVVVIVPPGTFNREVHLTKMDDGRAKVEIADELRRIQGRG